MAHYKGAVPYRYILEGKDIANVSFVASQLKKSIEDKQETTFKVKKIVGDRQKNNKKEYKVWWIGYLKKDSTWEPEKNLLEDGFQDEIDEYKKEKNAKNTKQRAKTKKI